MRQSDQKLKEQREEYSQHRKRGQNHANERLENNEHGEDWQAYGMPGEQQSTEAYGGDE